MLEEFRKFLLQTNALALAVGVIIGAAVGKVVGSLAADILMPVIGLVLPGGAWREAKMVLRAATSSSPESALTYGAFVGALVDFVTIALVVFLITKSMLKPAPAGAAPPTKSCPACLEVIPLAATKCRACASGV